MSDEARRMSQLLRRMVGEAGGGGSGRDQQRQRLKSLAEKMSQDDDSDQYVALTEFCETLNMATEDVMMALRAEEFIPPIIACLQKDYNIELCLLAARSLTYLIDAIPQAAGLVAATGGIPIICTKLQNIVDIDLAEQALTALAKISNEVPVEVLRNDGVAVLLGFIDFFSMSVQRKAVACVANLCKRCGTKYFDHVAPSLPLLHNYVTHEDAKMAESALLATLRVVQGVREDEEKLMIAFGDLTPGIIEILDKRACDAAFNHALKILTTVVNGSPKLSSLLLEFGLMFTLQSLISPHGDGASGTTPQRSPALGPATPSPVKGGPPSAEVSPVSQPSPYNSLGISSTPPSASKMGTAAVKTLSTEQNIDVCVAIVHLLPKVQEDFMLYWSPGSRRLPSGTADRSASAATTTAPSRHHASSHGDADDGEMDDEEEEEEEEMSDEEVKQRLSEMVASGQLAVKSDGRHKNCKVGNHSCDFCGAGSLQPEDWYRCNEMADFDSCSHCMYYNGAAFCEAEGKSFTYMSDLLSGVTTLEKKAHTASAAPSPPAVVALPVKERTSCPRQLLFDESPHLLQRVCEGTKVFVRFCRESEHPSIRVYGLNFISRVLTSSDVDTLRTLLADVPLCDYLRSCFEVANDNLELLPPLCYISKVLLDKLGDVYHELFVREGIVNALTRTKMHSSSATVSSLRPLNEMCATEAGWHQLLSARATAILAEFQNEGSSKVVATLEKLAVKFAEGSAPWTQCLQEFEEVYSTADGISTFELVTSNIVHQLLEGLRRHPNTVVAMIDMFSVLAHRQQSTVVTEPSSPGLMNEPPTVLLRLVQQLQTILSQFESFPSLTTGGLRSVTSQIRLKISPQSEEPNGESGDSSKQAAGGGEEKKYLSASVNIEPLATIGAVADFIQTRLMGGASTPKKSDGDGNTPDADTENILPDGKDNAATPSKSKAAAGGSDSGPSQVYVRYKNHTLRHNLSMVQVMQKFVQPSKDKNADKKDAKPKSKDLPPGLPKHLHEAFLMATRSDVDEVELVYSTKPFEQSVAKGIDTRATTADLKDVQLDLKALTHGASEVSTALSLPLRCGSEVSLPTMVRDCLILLRVLHAASTNWSTLAQYCQLAGFDDEKATMEMASPLPAHEFVNHKLNQKVMRQVTNPLFAGQLEDTWCVHLVCDCPFLCTANTRKFLFDVSFHGTARALSRLAERAQEMGEPQPGRSHRIQRHKLRVSRDRIFESARKIDELYGTSRLIFEMEFYGEEGSGLGPTQEFYALMGKDIQKRSLGLWRSAEDDDDSAEYHATMLGLFPKPCAELTESQTQLYTFIGRMIGRAVLDRRILNLRFARPLLKLLRGDAIVLDDIAMVSEGLYDVLFAMQCARTSKDGAVKRTINLHGKELNVEDLCLSFVLSGKEDLALCPGGADREVTFDTMGEYVDRTVSLLLKGGVEKQIAAMREGFDELVPIRSLHLLQLEDLAEMLSGHEEVVTMEELEAHTLQDHGFTPSSLPVRMLFEVLTLMTLDEQRLFFQFLTGSPRLPVGGLGSLRPKFTIVRKTSSSASVSEQDQLPSAMTCQNFLKLPAYETKEQLESKLRVAITEGRHGFNFT